MIKSPVTPRAAILAIGTEVTSGEIHNTNAAFLASKLTDFGFVCDLHLAVPDQREQMKWAIEFASTDHDIVMVTGGLGPTSDDFTRDVIASVIKTKLVWNDDCWQSIVKRLDSVGAPHAESNRQQAFFPEGATVFPNHHGTASAFSVQHGNSRIFALPGPPKEIEGIWHDHLRSVVAALAPTARSQIPKRWRCLGQSESKLGELVEDALRGSDFLTGYRSHQPYIDIKVWIPENRRLEFESKWRLELESKISPWLVGRDSEDAAMNFRNVCPKKIPICIIDTVTSGYIARRIFDLASPQENLVAVLSTDATNLPWPPPPECLLVNLNADVETGIWTLELTGHQLAKKLKEQSRYKGRNNANRLRAYIGEKTLLVLTEWLRSFVEA